MTLITYVNIFRSRNTVTFWKLFGIFMSPPSVYYMNVINSMSGFKNIDYIGLLSLSPYNFSLPQARSKSFTFLKSFDNFLYD